MKLHVFFVHRKMIFGMQTYFDLTRKTTSKKMEDNLKKMKMEDDPNFFEKIKIKT